MNPAHPALRIGLLADSTDPFWVEVRETIWYHVDPAAVDTRNGHPTERHDAAQPPLELVDIHASVGGLASQDVAARAEEILSLDLDALIAVPFAMPVIERLLESGLPVICLHARDLEHPLFSSPASLYTTAYLACDYLAGQLGGQGRVLCVGGNYGTTAENRSSRVQAARDVFVRYPGLALVHVPTPWDYAGAHEFLTAALEGTAEPFAGIFGLSDTLALLGREVTARRELLRPGAAVVGINGDPLAIAAVARGEMAATVVTSAARLAREALQLACEAAQGRPLRRWFDYQPQLVTRENVGEIALDRLLAIASLPSRLVGVNRRLEERRLTQLQTSLEINRRIGSLLERDLLLRELAELIRANYGYDHVQIYLWHEETQSLRSCLPGQGSEHPAVLPLAAAGVLCHTLFCNRAVYLPDLQQSSWLALDSAWPETRARVVVPIRLGDRVQGVLDLHSNKLHHHHQVDLDALQLLADQLGVAMRNAQLYTQALEARAEAERANLLKSRLLANISHELRTPLNIILGYSQSALGEPNPYGVALPGDLLQDLQHVVRSSAHLVQLIDDLLNLSQAEIGALEIYPEKVDVRALVAEVFHSMADNVRSGEVQWRCQLPTRLPALQVDPVRLRQVLLNLLSNAARFTVHGHITLGAAEEGDDLHIWVEDTGAGIPHELQARIFEAFEAAITDPEAGHSRRGVGLGLAVAHNLVRLHGGRLTLESRPGHGTLCHVYLPLGAPAEALPAQVAQEAPVGPDGLERVLQATLANTSDLTRSIAHYLTAHYAENVTRDEIADALRISANYVSRVFHRETGMTPWQFLNRYRIVQAQKLLLNSSLNVTEVAVLVGYNDPAYFVRVFHKEVGRSPQQYRRFAR